MLSLYISLVLLIVLAIIGLSELLLKLQSAITANENAPQSLLVVPICGTKENIEQILRHTVAQYQSAFAKKQRPRIICVNCGADADTLRVIERFCLQSSQIELIDKSQLSSLLSTA
ncbi:MAG: hypothetical protein LBM65_04370 [Oscillospiraceae bacterium]|nr:hypothetical protein [Oscillospiraceae bacterium]